jgi:hypothetical protein
MLAEGHEKLVHIYSLISDAEAGKFRPVSATTSKSAWPISVNWRWPILKSVKASAFATTQ